MVENKVNEYLNSFNLTGTKETKRFSNYDFNYVVNKSIYEFLKDKAFKNSKVKNLQRARIMEIGSELSISKAERVMIILYLIEGFHVIETNEIDLNNEEIVYWIGETLGLEKDFISSIIEFYLADQPFSDNNSCAYLVQNSSKFNYKQICMNVLKYEKENITYIKQLPNCNLLLSKVYHTKKDSLQYMDLNKVEKIRIVDENNFRREDFGYFTYREIIDSIHYFNPLKFYELEAKDNLPKIVLDPEINKVIIAGNSSPLSPTNFYNPLLEWISNFKNNNRKELKIYLMLDYFNTYTAKFLMRLTKECSTMSMEGCTTKLFWYYDSDDEDMREFGENLQSIYKSGVELCCSEQDLVA